MKKRKEDSEYISCLHCKEKGVDGISYLKTSYGIPTTLNLEKELVSMKVNLTIAKRNKPSIALRQIN